MCSELPTETKWQSLTSQSYINLALVDNEEVARKQQLQLQYSAPEDYVDQILKSKKQISLDSLLDPRPGKSLQCLLVEGKPGAGKTTLAWQVCHRWGKKELFQRYDLIVLVKLRDEIVMKAETLAELLICQNEDDKTSIAQQLKIIKGRNILIILEGLDELPTHLLTQPSVFTRLLSGKLLRSATLMVTSRPSATVQLLDKWKQRVSRRVKVLGFTRENIAECVQSAFDEEEGRHFISYIEKNLLISSLMYIPINCTIVLEVYKDCLHYSRPIPRTITELYSCLVLTLLRRYLESHGYSSPGDVDTFASLPPPVDALFIKLTELAYEGTKKRKYIFSTEIDHLGLMTAITKPYSSCTDSYSFLHQTVQEYLAAYHISVMEPQEQEQLLKSMYKEKQFRKTCQFLAGLTKFKDMTWLC